MSSSGTSASSGRSIRYPIASGIGTVCSTPWSWSMSDSAVQPWKVRNTEHIVEPGYCGPAVRCAASHGSYCSTVPSNRCRNAAW